MMNDYTELLTGDKPLVALSPVIRKRKANSLSVQIEKACYYLCAQNKPHFYVSIPISNSVFNTVTSTASRTVRYYVRTFRQLTLSPPLNIKLTYELVTGQKVLWILAEPTIQLNSFKGFLK